MGKWQSLTPRVVCGRDRGACVDPEHVGQGEVKDHQENLSSDCCHSRMLLLGTRLLGLFCPQQGPLSVSLTPRDWQLRQWWGGRVGCR